MPARPAEPAKFEFVTGNRPDQLKSDSSRKLRSYLSKRAWQSYFEAQAKASESTSTSTSSDSPSGSTSSGSLVDVPVNRSQQHILKNGKARKAKSTRRGNKSGQYSVTFEFAGDGPETSAKDELVLSGKQAKIWQGISDVEEDDDLYKRSREVQLLLNQSPESLPMDTQLGGGRVDPFKSYPTPWQPYIPALADHYVIHMAVDIPELDQPGSKGLLRSRWFPLVVSEPSCFRVIMLLSAANYASINGIQGLGCQILQLKQEAITAINEAFVKGEKMDKQVSDGLIGAVAKMASFEAMHGDVKSYKMHMVGLQRMVAMRGGLDALGLGGLLRRIIVWIDLNSSFLLQVPRYYPGTTFTGMETDDTQTTIEPNPERYIAA